MKALLDTNIIIHREANRTTNQDIGILFKWLDKLSYQKCVHRISINEIQNYQNKSVVDTFNTKLNSYEILETKAPLSLHVLRISNQFDKTQNDLIDTDLLNEVFNGRVDILISEDKKMHIKADALNIADKVFTINSFLEYIYSEYPDLVDYKVLSVEKVRMGEIDLNDPFFNTLREDYIGFDTWFNKKANDFVYITKNNSNNRLLSFLYLKVEDKNEDYNNIDPKFVPKKRLKIGTFKVVSNGVRLGERFIKIIIDNALNYNVDEIYVTIFDKREEQVRLINLLVDWGFEFYGNKNGEEKIYTKNFNKKTIIKEKYTPKKNYPFLYKNTNIFFVPIYPEYHTDLIPDSILHNENIHNFKDSKPHSNALSKVYISRSIYRDIKQNDIIIFYRTGGYFKSVITTIAIVENVMHNFNSFEEFKSKCKNRSALKESKLLEFWNYNSNNRPFLINFLYVYSFPKRMNLKQLIDLGIIKNIDDAPRGLKKISVNEFEKIISGTESKQDFIID